MGTASGPAGCLCMFAVGKENKLIHLQTLQFILLQLVGGLEHFLFFHIEIFITPTDELIFFRGVGLNHQPDKFFTCGSPKNSVTNGPPNDPQVDKRRELIVRPREPRVGASGLKQQTMWGRVGPPVM